MSGSRTCSAVSSLALLVACGGHGREVREIECVVRAPGAVRVETRACQVERSSDGYRPQWKGRVHNVGAARLDGLSVTVIARDGGGVELSRTPFDVLSHESGLAWLYPGYTVDVPSHWAYVLRAAPATLEIEVAAEPSREPVEPFAPLELTWPEPPAAGVALEAGAAWCGTGAEGVGPSAGRVLFDCLAGVRNTGTAAVAGIDLTVVFVDGGGAEVDRQPLRSTQSYPLEPGEALLFTGARGVLAHASSRLEVRLRR